MSDRPPEPFRFAARFALTFATGRRAASMEELRSGIAELPDAVIYRHTHRFLAEHQSLVPEPSNDFALWVEDALRDKPLAERLASVDILRMDTLEDVRREFLGLLDAARSGPSAGRRVPPGQEFHFLSARRFSVPTGLEAWDLASFAEALRRAGTSSLYLHLFEARLRPPLGVNDLSAWFRRLGEPDLAKAVSDPDLYRHTLEDVRRLVLELVRNRMEFNAAKEARRATA
jgi:hypothetical protein